MSTTLVQRTTNGMHLELINKLLNRQWESISDDEIHGLADEEIAKVLETIEPWDRDEQWQVLTHLFTMVTRRNRSPWLGRMLTSEHESMHEFAFDQIRRHELVELERYLQANSLGTVADEAISHVHVQLVRYRDRIENPRAWIMRVGKQFAIKAKDKLPDQIPDGLDLDSEISGEVGNPEITQAMDLIKECRGTALTEEEDQILDQYFFQERSGPEIAQNLEIPRSTFFHKKNMLLEKLRRCLESKIG